MSAATADYSQLRLDHCAGVTTLVLDRPERANALSNQLLGELVHAMESCVVDGRTRVLVLTGSGRSFCGGRDLSDVAEGNTARSPMSGAYRNVCETLWELPVPTVAAVNGAAVAAGCELALAADLRVAAPEAYFQLPEASRGLAANFGSVLLPRLVPQAVAYEMLYLGTRLSAADALRWGLVNRVAENRELRAETEALTSELVASAPLSLRRIKATVTRASGLPLAAALRLDSGPSPYESHDRTVGARAFLERRPPVWTNS